MGKPLQENFYNSREQLSFIDKSRLYLKGYKLVNWKGNGDNFYKIENKKGLYLTFLHLDDLKWWIRK